ncbi:MAG: InlB B-repeat-containing protein, partial [Oscillibacter sp.]|nr:InlB B-repeat-containing protein [Oscillibacter sp.]
MKKWLGVFMVFCMLFTMIQPFALAEGPTVVLDAAQVAQGDTEATVAVPISIRNNPGLLGLKVRVTYPEVLEVQNVAFEQVFGTETDNAADHRNPVVINWGGANEVTNDARLATINFSLKSDAQAGTYDFAVEVVEAFNDDNDWTLSVEKGQLTVTPNGGGEAATYAVTFNTNGGSEVPLQNVTSGGTASRPTPDPTRENYTFKNWYGDEALTTVFDFNTPITQPTTIYADWEEVSNPGPGQQNGATVVLGAAEVAQGDTQATVAVPISIRNNPGLLGLKVRVTYPEVLEVQNVAFEQVFGTETDNAADHRNPVVINWGGANEVTSDARLATINFSLKSDAQAGTYDFAVEVAEAFNDDNDWTLSVEKGQLTVTPPPQPQKVTVTFNGNGGTPATTTVEIDQGTTVTAPAQNPTRDGGYTFRGWFTSAAATQAFDFTAPVQSNTTVYAGWNDPQPQKVTVTFNGNGGTPATTEVEIDQGTTVTAPAQNPTREGGYTFRGWFADAAATQSFDFTAPIQNNTTVYAGWNDPVTPPTQKVTVTFNGN